MLTNFFSNTKLQFATAFGACVVFTGIAALVSGANQPNYSVTLRITHTSSAGSLADLTAYKFKELIEKNSKGQITVAVYPNNGISGGDQTNAFKMLEDGAIDVQITSAAQFSVVDPRFETFWLPYIFENENQVKYFTQDKEAQALISSWLEPHHLKLLSMYSTGPRNFSNNDHPIASPEDMKGLKMRVPPIEIAKDIYSALGADVVVRDYSEVMHDLSKGAYQGVEADPSTFISSKLYETQHYVTDWNGIYNTEMWVANDGRYESLSKSQQAALDESLKEALAWRDNLAANFDKVYLDTLKAKGVTITELTDTQRDQFRSVLYPLYNKLADRVGVDNIMFFLDHRGVSDAQTPVTVGPLHNEDPAVTGQKPAADAPAVAPVAPATTAPAADAKAPAAPATPAPTAATAPEAAAPASAESTEVAAVADAASEVAAAPADLVAAETAQAQDQAQAANKDAISSEDPTYDVAIIEVTTPANSVAAATANKEAQDGVQLAANGETTDDAAVEALDKAQVKGDVVAAAEQDEVLVTDNAPAQLAQAPVPAVTETYGQVQGFGPAPVKPAKVQGFDRPVANPDFANVPGFAPVPERGPSVAGFGPKGPKHPPMPVKGIGAPVAQMPVAPAPVVIQQAPVGPYTVDGNPNVQYVQVPAQGQIQFIEVAPGQFQAVQLIPLQQVKLVPVGHPAAPTPVVAAPAPHAMDPAAPVPVKPLKPMAPQGAY